MTSPPEPAFVRPRVAAGVLFLDETDRVLLVVPSYKDFLDLPGGYVEPGESPRAAAQREVREELAIEPPVGRLLVADWRHVVRIANIDVSDLAGGSAADLIAMMGDARAGDSGDSEVTPAYADTINSFARRDLVRAGDYTVESFTDGMSVDFSAVTGDPGRKGHEFNDIAPIHNPKSGEWIGGYANVLFADGHVAAVHDVGGRNNEPDGYLGAYKTTGSNFEINESGYREIFRVA